MKAKELKNLIIFESAYKPSDLKPVQESVFNAIEKGNCKWLTATFAKPETVMGKFKKTKTVCESKRAYHPK